MVSTFEVTVIKWETDAVEPQALEESCICIPEERFKERHHVPKKIEVPSGIPGRRNAWSQQGPLRRICNSHPGCPG